MKLLKALRVNQKARVKLDYFMGTDTYKDIYLPIVVKAEYPTWYLCEVLPHMNPRGWKTSAPYPVTISKWNLAHGFVSVIPYNENNPVLYMA